VAGRAGGFDQAAIARDSTQYKASKIFFFVNKKEAKKTLIP
jgi:hypothetical protein